MADRPVGDLVDALAVSQPAVSKHLRVLRDAGLVESRTEAQRRIYRVRTDPLQALDEWLRPYRERWTASLDDLERHLDTMPEARRGGPTMNGRLEPAGDLWRLRFTRKLAHSPDKVWRAITEPHT